MCAGIITCNGLASALIRPRNGPVIRYTCNTYSCVRSTHVIQSGANLTCIASVVGGNQGHLIRVGSSQYMEVITCMVVEETSDTH